MVRVNDVSSKENYSAETDAEAQSGSGVEQNGAAQNGVVQSGVEQNDGKRSRAESAFESDLRSIGSSIDRSKSRAVMVDLPKGPNGETIPANRMKFEDYEKAFLRSAFKAIGLENVTDAEMRTFQNNYQAIAKERVGLISSSAELRAEQNAAGDKIMVKISDYDAAVFAAGKREILRERLEKAVEPNYQYMDDTISGFYKIQVNALINNINGASKIFRLPEIPRFEVKGEYWKDKGNAVESGLTAVAGFAIPGGGGKIGTAADALDAAGSAEELIRGKDTRTGKELTRDEFAQRLIGVAVNGFSARGLPKGAANAASQAAKKIR